MDPRADAVCLCWGTVEGADLPELIATAGATGYASVATTPAMYFAARAAGVGDAALRELCDEHGVTVAMLDPLMRGLPGMPEPDQVARRFRSTFAHGEEDCFAAAEALGAPAINVAHFMGAPAGVAELADAIGAIARRAAPRGLRLYVEFMPEGSIPDLATAVAIVEQIALPNVGVMLDTWHHHRVGGTLDDIRALQPGVVQAIQVSDATADGFATFLHPPTADRLNPGDGVIPLAEIIAECRSRYPDIVVALEVFRRVDLERPAAERAQHVIDAYHRLMSRGTPPE